MSFLFPCSANCPSNEFHEWIRWKIVNSNLSKVVKFSLANWKITLHHDCNTCEISWLIIIIQLSFSQKNQESLKGDAITIIIILIVIQLISKDDTHYNPINECVSNRRKIIQIRMLLDFWLLNQPTKEVAVSYPSIRK